MNRLVVASLVLGIFQIPALAGASPTAHGHESKALSAAATLRHPDEPIRPPDQLPDGVESGGDHLRAELRVRRLRAAVSRRVAAEEDGGEGDPRVSCWRAPDRASDEGSHIA